MSQTKKTNSTNHENLDQLRLMLKEKGFNEEEIDIQLKKLSELILLSSMKRLAETKGIKLAEVTFSDDASIAKWLKKNFTDKEITDATLEASASTLSQYLKALEG